MHHRWTVSTLATVALISLCACASAPKPVPLPQYQCPQLPEPPPEVMRPPRVTNFLERLREILDRT